MSGEVSSEVWFMLQRPTVPALARNMSSSNHHCQSGREKLSILWEWATSQKCSSDQVETSDTCWLRRCRVIAFSGIFSALLVYFGLLGLRLIRLAHDSPKLSGAYSVGFLGNGTLSNCIHSIAEGRGHVLEAGAEQLDIAAEPYRISSGFSSLQQCVGLCPGKCQHLWGMLHGRKRGTPGWRHGCGWIEEKLGKYNTTDWCLFCASFLSWIHFAIIYS